MAHLEKQFAQFHDNIKLTRFGENKTLIEKREIVLKALREGLKRIFEEKGAAVPKFDCFNQGSYAMNIGVKPLNGSDYDIDVGLRFHIVCDETENAPLKVKGWVYDALEGHTNDVKIKRCCVTISYTAGYHVDLAIYGSSESNNGQDYLAKGYRGSSSENKIWETSDARKFIELIENHLSDEEGQQFRRTIRYLKRWKDFQFSATGNAAPVGIGLTILAYDHFRACLVDQGFAGKAPQDLMALKDLVSEILANFQERLHEGDFALRVCAFVPVEPRDDVFNRMSNNQMANLKNKLESLYRALIDAEAETDPYEAAKLLEKQFGDDFPIPDPDEGAKKSLNRAVITHSSSA